MGVEGGGGWYFDQNPQVDSISVEDYEAAARVLKVKFDENCGKQKN